jgi:hypothetical protein
MSGSEKLRGLSPEQREALRRIVGKITPDQVEASGAVRELGAVLAEVGGEAERLWRSVSRFRELGETRRRERR